jgi:predicted DsbA family dithiol-disulfide isomerase
MHQRLYDAASVRPEFFRTIIGELGGDAQSFVRCLQTDAKESVAEDVASAREFGVTGTPTFLIGNTGSDGRVSVVETVVGMRSSAEFSDILTKAVAAATR